MNYNSNWDEDEDNDSYRQYNVRDGIIFLIEVNEDMYMPKKELDGKSHIFEILTSINQLTQELVKTAPSTGIGIFFYNTSKQHKGFPVPNTTRLFRLHELNLDNMQKLNSLVDDELENLRTIKDRFPPAEETVVDVNEVLKFILDEFRTDNTKSFNRKKLIWFTNNNNPYNIDLTTDNKTNDEILSKTRATSTNYFDERILIVPVFLSTADNDAFDIKFFEEIFSNTNFLTVKDRVIDASDSGTMLTSKLRSNILKLKQVNRIQLACNLILSDGAGVAGNFGCAIRGYTLYTHEKPRTASHIYTQGESYKVVQTESSIRVKATDEVVEIPDDENLPTDADRKLKAGIRKGLEFKYKDSEGYKHDSLYFTNEQVSFLKNFTFDHDCDAISQTAKEDNEEDNDLSENDDDEDDVQVLLTKPPYLKLLGFRRLSKFQPFYNVSAPTFITYDTSDGSNSQYGYNNSGETFRALYQSCVKLERYAIVFGCTKKNALPNMYALYPTNVSKSSRSENFPQGFLLLRLPYLDDIRTLPTYMLQEAYPSFTKAGSNVEEETGIPSDLVSSFKQLVEALGVEEYNPADYPNPSLNFLYHYIKSDLLGLENTDNNVEKFDRSLTTLQDIFVKFQKGELAPLVKRINDKLSDMAGEEVVIEGPAPKKQKVESVGEMEILRAWKDGSLDQFNMVQLRGFVANYRNKIKSATKKADLIKNISEFLESRQK